MRSLSGSWLTGLRRALGAGRTTHGSGGHVTVWTVVALVASMAATVTGLGAANRVLDVQDASSWLWSSHKGEIARVNAVTSKVDTRHRLVDAQGHTVVVTQTDRYLILRDVTNGKITAIDLATLQASGTRTTTAGQGISIALHGAAAFVIDSVRGTVAQVDPVSLATVGSALTFPPNITRGGFDGTGTLWIAVPSEGTAAAIRPGSNGAGPRIERTVEVAEPHQDHDLVLSALDSGVAVLDPVAQVLVTVRGAGEPVTTIVHTGEPGILPARTVGETVPVTAVQGRHVYPVRDHEDKQPVFDVPCRAPGDHECGRNGTGKITAAVAFESRFYAFDEVTRVVYVLNQEGAAIAPIDVTKADGPVELEVREGHLFINGPNSNAAWVVDKDGRTRPVDKYADNILGGDKPTVPPVATSKSTPKIGPPDAPGRVTATAGNATARISWEAAYANHSPITSYVVEGAGKVFTVGPRQRMLLVAGLDNGTEYRFQVHAVNARGSGPKRSSNPVVPTAAVPDPPGVPNAVANKDGTVSVSWPAADGQGRKITGYEVTAVSVAGAAVVGTAPGTSFTVPAGKLKYGEQHYFTVVAISSGAISTPSAKSPDVVPFRAPGPPKNFRASTPPDLKGTVRVSWNDADDNGRPVTKYVVTAGAQTESVRSGTNSVDIKGLADGAKLTVSAHAVNLAGDGEVVKQTGVRTVAVPGVSIVSVHPSTNGFAVKLTVEDGGGTTECSVTAAPKTGDGGRTVTSNGCGSVNLTNLYAGKAFTLTVKATNAAGADTRSQPASTSKIRGYVNCTNDPAKPQPTYCNGDGTRKPGVGTYPQPDQRPDNPNGNLNHVWRDAECRADGQEVKSAWYNHYKGASTWWVRFTDGKYIPFTWFNLGESGDTGVGEPVTVLGIC